MICILGYCPAEIFAPQITTARTMLDVLLLGVGVASQLHRPATPSGGISDPDPDMLSITFVRYWAIITNQPRLTFVKLQKPGCAKGSPMHFAPWHCCACAANWSLTRFWLAARATARGDTPAGGAFLGHSCFQLFSARMSIHGSHDPSIETREDSPARQ